MIRAVIFDLDGTLVHSLPGLATALNRVLTSKGLPTHPEAAVRNFIGDGLAKLVERGCPENTPASQLSEITEAMAIEYGNTWQTGSPPFPGILDVLAKLKLEGFKLAIFSNKPDAFCQEFADLLFPDTFDVVIGQRQGVPTKPDPAGAIETAKRLGEDCQNIVFLGDSTMDIKTAHNAKMVAVAATWGYHDQPRLEAEQPDHTIHGIGDLLPLLNVE